MTEDHTHPKSLRHATLLAAGYGFFAIGLLGIALPLLPTTIFWILAAVCFSRSNPALYRRILSWPGFGPVIGAFLEEGVLSARSKGFALGGIAIGALLILFSPLGVLPRLVVLGAMTLAAGYVATRPEQSISFGSNV
jgi:uncharacterized membrane protein YbaN (DUF454 family)